MKDLSDIICPENLPQLMILSESDFKKQHGGKTFKQVYPLAWLKLMPLHNLYLEIGKSSESKGEKVISQMLQRSAGNGLTQKIAYQYFTRAIQDAKNYFNNTVEKFFPEKLKNIFSSDGIVSITNDPRRLLIYIWEPPGKEKDLRERRSFLANLYWHYAMRAFMMAVHNQLFATEDFSIFTQLMEEEYFAGGIDKVPLKVICDKTPQKRFHAFSKNGDDNVWEMEVATRRIPAEGDRHISVMFDSRNKTRDRDQEKTHLKSTAEYPSSYDKHGISLIFFSENDLEQGINRLMNKIFLNGGVLYNSQICGSGAKYPNTNSFSQGSQPEIKFTVHILGILVEVQIFHFRDYFNRNYSLGEENHHYYRLRQLWSLFPYYFPTSIFGVDWEDPATEQAFKKVQEGIIRGSFAAREKINGCKKCQ